MAFRLTWSLILLQKAVCLKKKSQLLIQIQISNWTMKLKIDQETIAERILTAEARSVVEEAAIGVAANSDK